MGEWETKKLGELLDLRSGGTPSMSRPEYWGGDIPWVSCKDMHVDRLYDAEDHVTEVGSQNGTRIAKAGELLLVVRGMILAKRLPIAEVMRDVTFNQDLKCISPRAGVLGRYLFYLIRSMEHQLIGSADEAAHGTKRLQTDRLLSAKAKLPSERTQRRIAAVLSAYDDLIENNAKRIRVLEEMARALYREWFSVDTLGSLLSSSASQPDPPPGWTWVTAGEAIQTIGGGTPSRTNDRFWDGGEIQWYSPTDLTRAATVFADDSGDHITQSGLDGSSAKMFPAFSVMMTSRATIGAIAINTSPACTNQGFITCVPSERVPLYFLYNWLCSNVPEFIRLGTGATFKEITRGTFRSLKMLLPSQTHVSGFEDRASPFYQQIHCCERKIRALRAARDLLLPKLLSGELSVDRIPDPAEATG